jgi:hypothetical protein
MQVCLRRNPVVAVHPGKGPFTTPQPSFNRGAGKQQVTWEVATEFADGGRVRLGQSVIWIADFFSGWEPARSLSASDSRMVKAPNIPVEVRTSSSLLHRQTATVIGV